MTASVPDPVPDVPDPDGPAADGGLPVSGEVAGLVAALAAATDRDLSDAMVVGACLEGDVTALARASHVLQAELAHRIRVGRARDALAHAPGTILLQQAWTRTGRTGW